MKVNFAVKRQVGCFNRVPSDQIIEKIINKHQKSDGGTTGYSTKPGTVQHWAQTSHIIAHCELHLEQRYRQITDEV